MQKPQPGKAAIPLSRQISMLMDALKAMRYPANHAKFDEVVKWVADIPLAARPKELYRLIARAFSSTEEDVQAKLEGRKRPDFEDLVPKTGWLHDYVEYTRNTEPPTVFHFFASLTTIGSTLARNVYFDKGAYKVFPNICAILVAPSGRCRKTSACNLAIGIYKSIGGALLADKTTPEALVDAYKDKASATGLIYAPELAVFLGKQKYQEGMVPMLTSLFDCPQEWSSMTVMRGEVKLLNVAFSMLGCSTLDWIQTAIPRDAFGGGFMSRLLFIVQESTPRRFALPPPLDQEMFKKLHKRLLAISHMRGKFELEPDARDWYIQWSNELADVGDDNKQYAGYSERKPDNALRLAMCMTVAEQDELKLSIPRLQKAVRILEWIESWLPGTFEQMSQSSVGEDHNRILRQLRSRNGMCGHSDLMRLNSSKLSGKAFRECMNTLIQSKLVDYDGPTHQYLLTPEGWKGA